MKGNDPTNGIDGIEGGIGSFDFFLPLHVFNRIADITEITVKKKISEIILPDENRAVYRSTNSVIEEMFASNSAPRPTRNSVS